MFYSKVVGWRFFQLKRVTQAQFYHRPEGEDFCVILPFLAVVLSALLSKIRQQETALRAFLLMLLVSFTLFAWLSLHTGTVSSTLSVNSGFVKQYIPATMRVGAFQSGVVGYFNDNVINLDGKVNRRALKALQTNSIEQYIDEARIDVIIDWRERYIHRYLSERWLTGWQPCVRQPATTARDNSLCLVRKDAEKTVDAQPSP